MSTDTSQAGEIRAPFHFTKRQAMLLVTGCTFLGAAGQVLFKLGSHVMAQIDLAAVLQNPLVLLDVFLNPHLFGGYCLYGMSTLLLVLALRDGELSVLYPIVSLTYVWVAVLSMLLFDEQLNVFKALGIAIIVGGVAVLGRNHSR